MSDVIVVGGGPAGATAALALAKAGASVRLLDRAAFPRNKPCGGGISLRVLRRFPYLARELGRIGTHTVSRLYLEGPGGESALIVADEPTVLLIRRVEFDNLLVSLAVAAGAELVTGAEIVQAEGGDGARAVTLRARDGRRFEAPIVVAADGVHSVVARRLGLRRTWPAASIALDMMEETPRAILRDLDPDTLWVSYGYDPLTGGRGGDGYAYIFPKRDHVNVGIGYLLDYYRREVDRPPYELQAAFVRELTGRGIVQGASCRRHFSPFLIPVGGPLRHPGRGRVLLAGDAGGFVNGFTAEGIYYAMVSGELAARAVLESASRGVATLAARYRRACNAEIGAELRDSIVLQRFLFADRRRISTMVKGARAGDALTRRVLEVAAGRTSYGRLRRTLVTRAPLLAWRVGWHAASARLRRS